MSRHRHLNKIISEAHDYSDEDSIDQYDYEDTPIRGNTHVRWEDKGM